MSDLTDAFSSTYNTLDWLWFCTKAIHELQDRKPDIEHLGVDGFELNADHLFIQFAFSLNQYELRVYTSSATKLWYYVIFDTQYKGYIGEIHPTPKWDYWYTALLSAYKALADREKDM